MAYTLPDASAYPGLLPDAQRTLLGHLFEPCEVLNSVLINAGVFSTAPASVFSFIDTCRSVLLRFLADAYTPTGIDPRVSAIIAAHPRLGSAKPQTLSSHLALEQALLGLGEEARKLHAWNERYEEEFPGLRYVVFVNGRSRDAVMEDMRVRIERGDVVQEREAAFQAMCDIAVDRARKLSALDGKL